jgi:hypothetical protein
MDARYSDRIYLKKSNGYSATSYPSMEPVSYYKDIPQYTREQYDWYSDKLPDRFEIIDVDVEYSYHIPYSLNSGIEFKKTRPIHRYFILDRFKFTLFQLMGCAGDVPFHVLDLFDKRQLAKVPGDNIWEYIRNILKDNRKSLYYNRIPAIILMLGLNKSVFFRNNITSTIIEEFKELVKSWEIIKARFNRKYFINLRYVCLRLLEKHGVTFPYKVPLARMDRSVKMLGLIYDQLWLDVKQRKLIEDVSAMFDE